MAQAKRPSAEKAAEELELRLARAQRLMFTRVKGTDIEFTMPPFENLPISFRRKIITLTGKTFGDLGIDGVHQACCLWWASRVWGGEDVSLPEVEAEWDERTKGTRLMDIKTIWVDGTDVADPSQDEDASPEA